jgi:hypothetical protein
MSCVVRPQRRAAKWQKLVASNCAHARAAKSINAATVPMVACHPIPNATPAFGEIAKAAEHIRQKQQGMGRPIKLISCLTTMFHNSRCA